MDLVVLFEALDSPFLLACASIVARSDLASLARAISASSSSCDLRSMKISTQSEGELLVCG